MNLDEMVDRLHRETGDIYPHKILDQLVRKLFTIIEREILDGGTVRLGRVGILESTKKTTTGRVRFGVFLHRNGHFITEVRSSPRCRNIYLEALKHQPALVRMQYCTNPECGKPSRDMDATTCFVCGAPLKEKEEPHAQDQQEGEQGRR